MPTEEKDLKSILIVDDDEQILDVLSISLEEMGFYAQTASNAAKALMQMGEHIFDLVITDVQMPGEFSGLDLLRIIKSGQNVPVIVMSGIGTIDTAFEAIREGAEDYLAKPLSFEQLKERIDRIFSLQDDIDVNEIDTNLSFVLDTLEQIAQIKILTGETLNLYRYDGKMIKAALRIIEEGLVNALKHGRKSPSEAVALSITAKKMGIVIKITDPGDGFDWKDKMTSLMPEKENARGLFIIKTLSNEISFNDSGNEVTVKLFC